MGVRYNPFPTLRVTAVEIAQSFAEEIGAEPGLTDAGVESDVDLLECRRLTILLCLVAIEDERWYVLYYIDCSDN